MVWLMVFVIYAAPGNAVDWNGPWKFGTSSAADQVFQSEADCRNGIEVAPISWTVCGLGSYVSASAVCMMDS